MTTLRYTSFSTGRCVELNEDSISGKKIDFSDVQIVHKFAG